MILRRSFQGLLVLALLVRASAIVLAEDSWQVGISTAKITPDQSIWMAGYGGRDRPAEATLTDLRLKVAALKAADGQLGIVVTSDLLGLSVSTEILGWALGEEPKEDKDEGEKQPRRRQEDDHAGYG